MCPFSTLKKIAIPPATLLIRFTRLILAQPNGIIITYCSRNRKITPFLASEKDERVSPQ